jgi:hypothetical protein
MIQVQDVKRENSLKNTFIAVQDPKRPANSDLHPAWSAFIAYCLELEHGEIETLKIQNGRPVLAQVTKKKVKFAP